MKRYITIILIMVAFVAPLFSQEPNPTWVTKMKELDGKIKTYQEQKKWVELSDCMNEQLELFEAQSVEDRVKYFNMEEIYPGFYYNLACYSSLAGKVSRALKAFEKYCQCVVERKTEVDLGHIQTDSDLNNIRNHKRFIACMERITPFGDYIGKLKKASPYNNGMAPGTLKFRYMAQNDTNLVFLRQHYNLDSVAGAGDEISKIKNLLHWVHEVVRHDGSSANPTERNTHAIIELCKKENRGVNCRMMASMLTEVYLAMGFKARFITCMPRDFINDCHVITTVYSCTLNKWLWVDPTFDAYVTDEHGTMLSIAEVRERLRTDKELRLNDYANWNHQSKQTKESYIDSYMAKNLYYLSCMEESRYNAETYEDGRTYRYFILMPYYELSKEIVGIGDHYIRFADEQWFWQSPYDN